MARPSRTASSTRALLTIWLVIAIGYITLIPVSNNVVLYSLLLSLGIIAGISIIRDGLTINSVLLVPATIWITFVAYGIAVAILRGAESWPRTLVFLLLWPVFYFVLVVGFKRFLVKIIFYVGAFITLAISILFLLTGLAALGHTPFDSLPVWITAPIGLRYVTDDTGAVALTAHSLPPLMWWGAMWIASLAVSKRDLYLPPLWIRLLAGSFAIAASVVAWRRAIVIVLVLVPLVMLVIWLLLRVKNGTSLPRARTRFRPVVFRVCACFVLAGALSIGVQTQLSSMVTNGVQSVGTVMGFDTSGLSTAELDASQKPALISEDDRLADKIRQNELASLTLPKSLPDAVFGHGIGASFNRQGVIRDMKPWQTELQYHGMYYWTGFIGLMFLIATLVTSVRAMRYAFRLSDSLRGVLFVSCIGGAATLIGNATNPYFQAPGHMWPVFFPFMIACVILASERSENAPVRQLSIRFGRNKRDAVMNGESP